MASPLIRVCRLRLFNRLVALTGLAALAAVQVGCRQTNGSTAAGPLQPFTSPDGSMAAPSLLPLGGGNPFGTSGAKVAPPTSGTVPNNYMGGTPTANLAPTGSPTTAAFAGSSLPGPENHAIGSQAIGSGVTQAGWQADPINGAAPINGVANAPGLAQTSATFSDASSPAAMNPARSGGMPVIDLTNAPPPPGYYVTYGNEAGQPASNAPTVATSSVYPSTSFATAGDSFPAQNLAPVAINQVQVGNVPSTAPPRVRLSNNTSIRSSASNSMARDAIASNAMEPSFSRPIEAAPSTRPIEAGQNSGDLPWQNPVRR